MENIRRLAAILRAGSGREGDGNIGRVLALNYMHWFSFMLVGKNRVCVVK